MSDPQDKPFFEGIWLNSYGSRMTLHSVGGGLYWGRYESTTGSTGTYHVAGFGSLASPTAAGFGSLASPTADQGAGIALTIYWRSYEGGSPDPSWHWVSGLGGQGLLQPSTISLNHAMVATCVSPKLDVGPGTYLDKLLYSPVLQRTATPPLLKGDAQSRDPALGVWVCATTDLRLTVTTVYRTGYLEGTLTTASSSYPAVGFADLHAQADGLALEGLSIAAFADGQYVCLSGWLDLETCQLTLLNMTSNGTPTGDGYLQTAARELVFVPADRIEKG